MLLLKDDILKNNRQQFFSFNQEINHIAAMT